MKTLLLGAAGMGAGLAVRTVQQPRTLDPDPVYHQSPAYPPKRKGELKPLGGVGPTNYIVIVNFGTFGALRRAEIFKAFLMVAD
jgi:hypothetical protein